MRSGVCEVVGNGLGRSEKYAIVSAETFSLPYDIA